MAFYRFLRVGWLVSFEETETIQNKIIKMNTFKWKIKKIKKPFMLNKNKVFFLTLDNINEFRSRVIEPTEGCDLAVKYQVGI